MSIGLDGTKSRRKRLFFIDLYQDTMVISPSEISSSAKGEDNMRWAYTSSLRVFGAVKSTLKKSDAPATPPFSFAVLARKVLLEVGRRGQCLLLGESGRFTQKR
jgi:hypothetical protein